MEQVTIGNLAFAKFKEADEEESVTVSRAGNKDVYATFTRCNDDQREWNYLKKNCWPANGVGANPPFGKWVLLEYVGAERSSNNLEPEKHEHGFTERELLRLTVTVNAIFGDDDGPVLQVPKRTLRRLQRRREKNDHVDND